jgi:superfamily I DNA/RNA helicase
MLLPKPTEEQEHILDLVAETTSNLLVNAYAGTGKTATLKMILNAHADRVGEPCMYVAFNKAIVREMAEEQKNGDLASIVKLKTLNSLGHGIWAKACSKVHLDPDKNKALFKYVVGEIDERGSRDAAWEMYFDVLRQVSLAKNLGYIPEGKFPHAKRLCTPEEFYGQAEIKPSPFFIGLVDTIITLSIKQAMDGTIDYDDQLFMPTLFGGSWPRFPFVVVDEAQDLSPINHAMLKKLGTGRLVVVGDRYQSIYGFRGAVTNGMQALKERFGMVEAPLSVSFRCPSEIVKGVHWRVPNFRWSREGGTRGELASINASDLAQDAAIICRNNAPLFSLGFRLLAAGRGVSISGSEVGPRIAGILNKIAEPEDNQAKVLAAIDAWEAAKLSEAKAPQSTVDMANCLRVFARKANSCSLMVAHVKWLFDQQGPLKLLTGHRSKGLEFDTVYHIDDWMIDRKDEQEKNLRYVIDTRAKQSLFLVNSEGIAADADAD